MDRRERFLGLRQRSASYFLSGAFAVLVLVLGANCGSPRFPTALPDGGDACDAMCTNERAVNVHDPCPGYTGEPSPGGTSCEDACRSAQPEFNLHAPCIAQSATCAQMKACFAQNQ